MNIFFWNRVYPTYLTIIILLLIYRVKSAKWNRKRPEKFCYRQIFVLACTPSVIIECFLSRNRMKSFLLWQGSVIEGFRFSRFIVKQQICYYEKKKKERKETNTLSVISRSRFITNKTNINLNASQFSLFFPSFFLVL